MKVTVRLWAMLALSLAALLPAPALAKSPPDKITVEGPGLAAPVEITDPADLAEFSPWSRRFIWWDQGLVTAPPPADQTYTVSFYLRDRKIYVVEYAPDPSGAPGALYFPGPGHPSYRLNIGTIIGASTSDRWAPEGKWYYATAEWDLMIQRALRAHRATSRAPGSPVGDTPFPSAPVPRFWAVSATAIGLMGSLTWVIRRRHQHTTG
ncbi:MAG: hypothetical protein HY689_16040 [Chloroflexi bacterium]|nr:hypothetical protein [Chloroflexota bacterium]